MNNVDKLITPMDLTDELLNTQFYDKIEEYQTLEYNKKNCRLEELQIRRIFPEALALGELQPAAGELPQT